MQALSARTRAARRVPRDLHVAHRPVRPPRAPRRRRRALRCGTQSSRSALRRRPRGAGAQVPRQDGRQRDRARLRQERRRRREGPREGSAPTIAGLPVTHVAGGALAAAGARAQEHLRSPEPRVRVEAEDGGLGTVGEEYDAWTEEGILEYYWGEHIHLGWYSDEDMAKGAGTLLGSNVKNFIEAKFDFVDKMLEWSECPPEPARVLDVGCGIGGTSRAKRLDPTPSVQGITLARRRSRARYMTELAKEQGVPNAEISGA